VVYTTFYIDLFYNRALQKHIDEVELFFSSLKSPDTKQKYRSYFKKYLELTGLTVQDLRKEKDPRIIEMQIIDFINSCKNEGMNWGAIHNYITMIQSFCKINDIVLNTAKINRFMPEHRSVRKGDRGYTHEEISKMLEFCDERTRVIVLLLASTGMRIGAIPTLKKSNIDNYKVTIYENDREEYFSFMTPECKQAIDNYIDMRSRYGEKIEDDSYLIREQFDIRDKFAIKNCRSISRETLLWKLREIAERSNVKNKQVPIAHGFRKFAMKQFVNSKLNPEIREMLLGHKIGLAGAYYKPTEQEMFEEYQKAVNLLTINEENRLKIKVQTLESKEKGIDEMKADLDNLTRMFYEKFSK